MNRLFLISSCLLFSTLSLANNPPVNEKYHEETCKQLSSFAYMAMGARQNGMQLSEALDIANSIPDESERSIARSIVIDAYKETRYSSKEYRENARVDFSNKYMLGCIEMYK